MGQYDDILHLPHHISTKRTRMPMLDRAAQFSPFAALTGYEDLITETGRLTEDKMEPEEYMQGILDQKQQQLLACIASCPDITVTYFVPDARKSGGAYAKVTGKLKKIDPYARVLFLMDGTRIPLSEIIDIESDIFTADIPFP